MCNVGICVSAVIVSARRKADVPDITDPQVFPPQEVVLFSKTSGRRLRNGNRAENNMSE